MGKIIAFPALSLGLGPQDRAPLQDIARRLFGTWRCEPRLSGERCVEAVMIPEEWGCGDAPAFLIRRSRTGFILLDCRRTHGFGQSGAVPPDHLGTFADTRDIALVIADLVGVRSPARPVMPARRVPSLPKLPRLVARKDWTQDHPPGTVLPRISGRKQHAGRHPSAAYRP
jgi:hypothetical protein